MANIKAGEPKKMLMIDAMIIPITPIIKNAPHPDMSFFVVYPHKDRPAKAIEVTKNVWTIETEVYTIKIELKEIPIRDAKTKKSNCAAAADDFRITCPKPKNNIPSGASITIHLKGER